jgi:1,4-dihydroxy-2-naphthoate polyprenyltransferase
MVENPNNVISRRSNGPVSKGAGIAIQLIKTARLQFIVGCLVIFVLGGMLAVINGAAFDLVRLLLGALVVLPAQLAVNLSNDYYDVDSDKRGGSTLISGGAGVLLEHPELRRTVIRVAAGAVVFSLGMGLVFLFLYHYPAWMYGLVILGNLLGWTYSAPPVRLVQRGWGEIPFLFITGILVPAMGYLVVKGTLDGGFYPFILPLIFYGLIFVLSVEFPDVEDDLEADKRTWIARMGRRSGFTITGSLVILTTIYFFLADGFFPTAGGMNFRLLGWFSIIPLVPGVAGLIRRPAERGAATRIATWTIIGLVVFSLLVDGTLIVTALK